MARIKGAAIENIDDHIDKILEISYQINALSLLFTGFKDVAFNTVQAQGFESILKSIAKNLVDVTNDLDASIQDAAS